MAIYKCNWEVEPGDTRNKFKEWSERVLNPGSPNLKASALTTRPHCLHLFDILVGCRQGALESPVPFNIYTDFVVRVARQEVLKERPDASMKIEYCIPNEVSPRDYRSEATAHGTTRITEMLYADDEAIFANSIEELKIILEIYDRTCARFGLKMSYSKTETMAFNVDEEIIRAKKV